eukprot:4419510-Prymnesium_polylepis.1
MSICAPLSTLNARLHAERFTSPTQLTHRQLPLSVMMVRLIDVEGPLDPDEPDTEGLLELRNRPGLLELRVRSFDDLLQNKSGRQLPALTSFCSDRVPHNRRACLEGLDERLQPESTLATTRRARGNALELQQPVGYLASLECDRDLAADVYRPLCQLAWCRVYDLLELNRVARAARVPDTRKFMTRLQVRAHPLRLPDLGRKRLRVVRAAVHTDGSMAIGELEVRGALQEDVTLVEGQQPLAHEHHGAVLKGRDARPLERRLLEKGVAHLVGRRHVDLGHTPVVGPLGELLLQLPRFHPLVCHDLANHRLREDTVHLRVWQQQRVTCLLRTIAR